MPTGEVDDVAMPAEPTTTADDVKPAA